MVCDVFNLLDRSVDVLTHTSRLSELRHMARCGTTLAGTSFGRFHGTIFDRPFMRYAQFGSTAILESKAEVSKH